MKLARQAKQQHPRSALVDRFVDRHGGEVLRVARRFSATATDAEDVYQRALEILLTKGPDVDDETLKAWTLTVARNEAIDQGRRGNRFAGKAYEAIAETWSDDASDPGERLVERESHLHGREALSRLRPDQARCLLLRADGMSYSDISSVTGFSYAKVNRCLSEGRCALRGRLSFVESGAECRRLEPVLSMIADGVADAAAQADADIHLAGCLSCRATLRDFRAAPAKLGAILPVGAAFDERGAGVFGQLGDYFQSLAASIQERVFGHVGSLQQGGEMTIAKKAVVVTTITAALTAGGATVERVVSPDGSDRRPPSHETAEPQSPIDNQLPESGSGVAPGDSGAGSESELKPKSRSAEREDVAEDGVNVLPDSPSAPSDEPASAGDPEAAPPSPPEPVDSPAPGTGDSSRGGPASDLAP